MCKANSKIQTKRKKDLRKVFKDMDRLSIIVWSQNRSRDLIRDCYKEGGGGGGGGGEVPVNYPCHSSR
jgi:hypothetical protein